MAGEILRIGSGGTWERLNPVEGYILKVVDGMCGWSTETGGGAARENHIILVSLVEEATF